MPLRREWRVWEIVALVLVVEAVGVLAWLLLWWGLRP